MQRRSRRRAALIVAVASTVGAGCGGADPEPNLGLGPANGTSGQMAFVGLNGAVRHVYLMTDETYHSWSPGGTRLAYQGDRDGSAVYLINADGTGQPRLFPTPGLDVTPSWSPDGTQIVYARLYAAPQPNQPPMTDIRVMNADGTGDHSILVNTLFSVEPRWSVNDQIVLMSLMSGAHLQIFVMNSDGTNLQQLTDVATNADPVWSPDGMHISFGSDREGGGKLDVFLMDSDGSNQTQLTHFDAPDEAGDTNWSRDGNRIAFEYDVSGMKLSSATAFAQVWIMNADGSDPIRTGVQFSDVGYAPRWQP